VVSGKPWAISNLDSASTTRRANLSHQVPIAIPLELGQHQLDEDVHPATKLRECKADRAMGSPSTVQAASPRSAGIPVDLVWPSLSRKCALRRGRFLTPICEPTDLSPTANSRVFSSGLSASDIDSRRPLIDRETERIAEGVPDHAARLSVPNLFHKRGLDLTSSNSTRAQRQRYHG
jgi:hypothetical protein